MTDTAKTGFAHRHFAHCESGSTSNLLFHYGISASEALVFGMGSGLFFGYFPFIKLNGLPLITFRSLPRKIIRNVTKRLGIKVEIATFKDPEKSMEALDGILRKGVPVGLQTSVYWLPYFPPPMREHFNSHFIVAYRMNGNSYFISDPIFDKPVTCPREDLIRARFSKGTFAPNGRMFHFTNVPERVDLASAVIKGIKETCFVMLKVPIPIMGVKGIRFFSKNLKNWPEKHGEPQDTSLSRQRRQAAGRDRDRGRGLPLYVCRLPPGSCGHTE